MSPSASPSRWRRVLRHLFTTRAAVGRRFAPAVLARIETAVHAAEQAHDAEIRVVVETDLDLWSILDGRTPRERALEVFASLGVWDTERNNGVLIYVLYADRDVEIVADRGYVGRVSAEEWRTVCSAMEAEFRVGRWEEGVRAGVAAAAALAARHYPPSPAPARDELPNRPLLL